MRSINVKKLVAIAGGAALLGAALTPLVGAAVNLQKSDIYNSTGQANVDIVVGTNGADVSDYMAAGNIARAISNHAVTSRQITLNPTAGSTGTANVTGATVTVRVGGTTTVSQDARQFLDMNVLSQDGSVAEIKDQNVGDAFFETFANDSKDYTVNSADSSYTNIEQIRLTTNLLFDASDSDVEDFVAYIEKGDLRYLSLISGGNRDINAGYTDDSDTNYLPISFLGKPYVIDSITSSAVVLVSDNPARTFVAGDSFEAVGIDGKTYTVVVSDIYTNGANNEVELTLQDAEGNVVDTDTAQSSQEIVFKVNGQEVLSTVISVDSVRSAFIEGGAQGFSVRLIIGADRVEIRNNEPFPYYTGAEDSDWEGHLLFANGGLKEIGIKNDNLVWDDTNPLISSAHTFNQDLGPTSISLFEGTDIEELGTVEFKGWYTQGVNFTDVSFTNDDADVSGASATYGSINFTTTDSVEHNIPALIRLSTSNDPTSVYNFTFAGKDYSYTFDRTNDIFTLKQGDLDSSSFPSAGVDVNVPIRLANGQVDRAAPATDINVTLSENQNNFSVKYVLKRGRTSSGTPSDDIYLALRTQDFGTLEWTSGHLSFLGTLIDSNAGNPWAFNVGNGGADANFALDYNNTGAAGQGVDLNKGLGWYNPSLTDWNGVNPSNSPYYYRFAAFRIAEGASGTNAPGAGTTSTNFGRFTVLIDTEDGWSGTVDTTADSRTGYSNNGTAVYYNAGALDVNLLLSEDNDSSDYSMAWSDFGTKVWVDDREAFLTLPSSMMKGYVVVAPAGSVEVQTGGDVFEVMWGKSVTTGGTTVAIDDITGVTVTGGSDANAPAAQTVTVMEPAAANGRPMVKSDQSAPSGTVILVGGPFVNRLSAQLTDAPEMQSASDVAPVALYTHSNGSKHILVAGYTADGTTQAANDLISWLNSQ